MVDPNTDLCYAWFYPESYYDGTPTCMDIRPNGELEIAEGSVSFRSINVIHGEDGTYGGYIYRLRIWKSSDYLGSITTTSKTISRWSEDFEGATKFKLEVLKDGEVCLYSKENFSGDRRCYEKDTKHNVPWTVGSIEVGRSKIRFLMYTQMDFKGFLGSIRSSVPKLDEKFQGFQSFRIANPPSNPPNGRPNGIFKGKRRQRRSN